MGPILNRAVAQFPAAIVLTRKTRPASNMSLQNIRDHAGGVPAKFPYRVMISLPALLLASWLGMIAFRRIDGLVFRKAVLMMLIVSGLAMLRSRIKLFGPTKRLSA
jgi:hypothetical protein